MANLTENHLNEFQGDAKASAAEAAVRFADADESRDRRCHGQQEAASVRGRHALYMEHLRHDYTDLMDELGHKQRADVNRRQMAVANIPVRQFSLVRVLAYYLVSEGNKNRLKSNQKSFEFKFFDKKIHKNELQ